MVDRGYGVDSVHYRPPNQPRSPNPPRKRYDNRISVRISDVDEVRKAHVAGVEPQDAPPRPDRSREDGRAQRASHRALARGLT